MESRQVGQLPCSNIQVNAMQEGERIRGKIRKQGGEFLHMEIPGEILFISERRKWIFLKDVCLPWVSPSWGIGISSLAGENIRWGLTWRAAKGGQIWARTLWLAQILKRSVSIGVLIPTKPKRCSKQKPKNCLHGVCDAMGVFGQGKELL